MHNDSAAGRKYLEAKVVPRFIHQSAFKVSGRAELEFHPSRAKLNEPTDIGLFYFTADVRAWLASTGTSTFAPVSNLSQSVKPQEPGSSETCRRTGFRATSPVLQKSKDHRTKALTRYGGRQIKRSLQLSFKIYYTTDNISKSCEASLLMVRSKLHIMLIIVHIPEISPQTLNTFLLDLIHQTLNLGGDLLAIEVESLIHDVTGQ